MNEKKREAKSAKRAYRVADSVAEVFTGKILSKDYVIRQFPFLLFIMVLALVYIGNSYSTERTIISINEIKKENEELRYEHILFKSRLMDYSKQSEVAKKLKETGLKESVIPPYKIYPNRNNR